MPNPTFWYGGRVYWAKTAMKKGSITGLVLGFIALLGCGDAGEQGLLISTNTFDFSEGAQGWIAGFADYPATPEDSIYFELKQGHVTAPSGKRALLLSGQNHNSDLFFFIKRKVVGLQPNVDYTLTFEVGLEADGGVAVTDFAQQVFVKVGASAIEPKRVIDGKQYVMNIDKGNHQEDGSDMSTIGTLGSAVDYFSYSAITLNNTSVNHSPFTVTSNQNGEVWIIVGADAAYAGPCELNFTSVSVVLTSSY